MTQTKLVSALRPIGILGLVRESNFSATDERKEPDIELLEDVELQEDGRYVAISGRLPIERQLCIHIIVMPCHAL